MQEDRFINAESYLGIVSPGKTQQFVVADAVVHGERRGLEVKQKPKLLTNLGN